MTDTPTVVLDIDDLSLDDIEDFKAHTGRELGEFIQWMQSLGDDPAAMLGSDLAVGLAVLVWLSARKTDPDCTLADIKRLPLKQVMAMLGTDSDGDGGDVDPLPVGDRPELTATGSSPASGSPATGD